jgi:Domain of unknown function (DUF4388)
MSLSSSFTDFSLAELFQLIDQGRKSGCLTVCTLPDLHSPGSKSHYFYMWFRQGRVIAAANRLNGQGLSQRIAQRGWVNSRIIEDACAKASVSTPLGLLLKTEGMLSAEHLNLLFANQLQQVRELFEIQTGVFKLDSKAALPLTEMTGLSVRAIDVALMALRTLKDWSVLTDALPDESSAIESISQTKPQNHLHAFEWQIWEFANGNVSLSAIASQLNQPTALVQQAAFRLMLTGLVQEVLLETSAPDISEYPMVSRPKNSSYPGRQKSKDSQPLKISTSFLQNLVGFLKSKA